MWLASAQHYCDSQDVGSGPLVKSGSCVLLRERGVLAHTFTLSRSCRALRVILSYFLNGLSPLFAFNTEKRKGNIQLLTQIRKLCLAVRESWLPNLT
ncbi:hypothetical protein Q8A67_008081 [Cirrhinus molitorella]|uniref:Uncharacterized protein n=1 Tax=Cirrhinus molitorella TaxID=172907 RepID=A0AA88TQE9_9TELE|nr:hypothetical protein Q8A67_008081 [Cirrhinus molitorella]